MLLKLKVILSLGLVFVLWCRLQPVVHSTNFGGPWEKGEKGSQGIQGPRGLKGDPGLKGEPGRLSSLVPNTICVDIMQQQSEDRSRSEDSDRSKRNTLRSGPTSIVNSREENEEEALTLLFGVCLTTFGSDDEKAKHYIFDTTIFKGEPGEKGQKGEMGVGLPGVPGPSGPKGEMGDMGLQGVMGEKGMKGETGEPVDDDLPTPATVGIFGIPQQAQSCGPQGLTYIHWGEATCLPSTSILYSGSVVASTGNSGNLLCIPKDPKFPSPPQLWFAPYTHITRMTPVLYADSRRTTQPLLCALCYKENATSMFVLPGSTTCPAAWTREYQGALMTSHKSSASDIVCVDGKLQRNIDWRWSPLNTDLNIVKVMCPRGVGSCQKYSAGYSLPCALCTK